MESCGAGTVEIKQAGVQVLSVRAKDAAGWKAVNVRDVRINPVE
jgi:hypothetical protein